MLIRLLDGHNDIAIRIRASYNNHIYNSNFTTPFEEGGLDGEVDIPRLREGLNGGFFWSAFVPCPEKGNDFSDENYAPSEPSRPGFGLDVVVTG